MINQYNDKQLKMAIADAIFSDPDDKLASIKDIDDAKSGIISLESHRMGNLEMQIRVKTQHSGTHYYTLKLSEMI
jgi:hypothetical protein